MASVRRALVAVYIERYVLLGLSFVMLAISSRLLSPQEIGLSVIGSAYIAIADSFRDFGVTAYVVNAASLSRERIQAAFTMMMVISASLALAVVLSANWYASLYNEPALAPFVYVVVIGFLFSTVGAPVIALLRRDMNFQTIATTNIISAVISTVLTLSLILAGVGFMSFAWGALGWAVVSCLLFLVARPDLTIFRPRFRGWRKIIAFGGYNTVAGVLGQLSDMLPILILGRVSATSSVAVFSRAQQVSQLPAKVLLSAVGTVALAGFADHVRRGGDLKQAYLQASVNLTAIQWPALLMVALLAQPIVTFILGHQWQEVVILVQILALSATLSFTNGLSNPALIAAGGVRETTTSLLISLPITMALMIAAALHGPLVLALSTFITIPIQLLPTLWFLQKRIGLTHRELYASLAPSLVVSCLAMTGPAVIVAANGFDLDFSFFQAAMIAVLGGLSWYAAVVLTRHPIAFEIKRLTSSYRLKLG